MYYIIYRPFDCRVAHGIPQKDCIGWSPYRNMPDVKRAFPILKVVKAPEFSRCSHKDDCFTEYFPETHHHDCGLINYL